MKAEFEKIDLEDLELGEIEVLNVEDTMGMAEGGASFLPSIGHCSTSIIATSTSSI